MSRDHLFSKVVRPALLLLEEVGGQIRRRLSKTLAFLFFSNALATAGLAAGQIDFLTIDCVLSPVHEMSIEKGVASHKSGKGSTPLTMTFSGFNESSGTVKLIGNAGADDVDFLMDGSKLVIIQITKAGNVSVTSMNVPGTVPNITAVHSRHMWLGGTGIISHYSGPCRVR